MKTIITTVGTSLIGNYGRHYPDIEEPSDENYKNYLRKVSEAEAAAETNSIGRVPNLSYKNDQFVFIHTKTKEGVRCANLLSWYYKEHKKVADNRIDVVKINLTHDEIQFETQGLRSLVTGLIELIEDAKRKGNEIVINATGGFKAEIAYTTMVGMIYQVPVYYIYIDFENLVTFPAMPIDWNIDLIFSYSNFFEWIDSEPRKSAEVKNRLKGLTDQDREQIRVFLTPPDSEDYVFLSPAGDAFYRRYRFQLEQIERTVDFPNESDKQVDEKIALSKHTFPKGTEQFCRKIAKVPYVDLIYSQFFESTTKSKLKNTYGNGSISMIYSDGDKGVNLTVMTTADNKAQALKVAEECVRPIIDNL